MSIQNRVKVIEKSRDFLMAQGKQSVNDEHVCLYRAEDGSMCAVGCLIPNDLYDSKYEDCAPNNLGLNEVMVQLSELYGVPMDTLISDLVYLQNKHDGFIESYDGLFSPYIEKEYNKYIQMIQR